MTCDMISTVADGVWLHVSGEMVQHFSPGLALLIALTCGSGGLAVFGLVRSVASGHRPARHKPAVQGGSAETVRTFRLSWAHGLLFLASATVFCISFLVLMASQGLV